MSKRTRLMRDKRQRHTIGPFKEWLLSSLPKCVSPTNYCYSIISLTKEQMRYVLEAYGYRSYKEYLGSEIWKLKRIRVLRRSNECHCGCGRLANQVHHKVYTENNLFGDSIVGLVAINSECHEFIEFTAGEKNSLSIANRKLNARTHDANKYSNAKKRCLRCKRNQARLEYPYCTPCINKIAKVL